MINAIFLWLITKSRQLLCVHTYNMTIDSPSDIIFNHLYEYYILPEYD